MAELQEQVIARLDRADQADDLERRLSVATRERDDAREFATEYVNANTTLHEQNQSLRKRLRILWVVLAFAIAAEVVTLAVIFHAHLSIQVR